MIIKHIVGGVLIAPGALAALALSDTLTIQAPPPVQTAPSAAEELPETLPEKTAPPLSSGIPKALADLMSANNVNENMLRAVVAQKGYFPADMPVADYPADFVNGVLIGAWAQGSSAVKDMLDDDYPF